MSKDFIKPITEEEIVLTEENPVFESTFNSYNDLTDEDVQRGKKPIKDYIEEAKRVYRQREIARVAKEVVDIAFELKEKEDREKDELVWSKCKHENTTTSNHGYHEWCRDCGYDIR